MEPISLTLLAVTGQTVAFYALAALAIAGALLMVTGKNPVASVLWLVLSFLGLAGLFLVLEAYFIAVIQILVYAGAIMVLFLFVIMLLNLRREDIAKMTLGKIPVVGVLAGVLFLAAMFLVVSASKPFFGTSVSDLLAQTGPVDSVKSVGMPLYRQWLLPFEITSILLLAAIIGAVALTKRRL